MKRVNPFKPSHPAAPGMFAGRLEEIEILNKSLYQTKNDCAENVLITGERGIGKSSLLNLIRAFATGEITHPDYASFNFVAVDIVISNRTSLTGLIEIIDRVLKREIGKFEKMKKFLDETWGFVQRIKVLDSGIDPAQADRELDMIIDDFSYSLSETCRKITCGDGDSEAKNGIVIFIDEADNASPELHIGYFFKVVTELLQRHSCNKVMFVVAGLPDVVDRLSTSHESSLRLFHPLSIRELSVEDRKYVIQRGIDTGNEVNQEKTTVSEGAVKLISTLSEGYPHFIQQFAYSAFEANKDGEISAEDVAQGAFYEGGALDSIGTRYYASAYTEQIKSDDYREVLTIMAERLNGWIKKSEIRKQFSGADHTVTDALKALTARKIILKNPSKMGEYRLQQRGFAVWIKLFGEKRQGEAEGNK